jgi:hypothetical protein
LRSKNPKEYWKILNKGQKKKQPNISIDVLYEFFKNLNGAPDHDDVELSVLSESLQENHKKVQYCLRAKYLEFYQN